MPRSDGFYTRKAVRLLRLLQIFLSAAWINVASVVSGACLRLCLAIDPARVQDREELFAYEINWQVVETQNIIQAKMRPWIVKKIIEYLGEEEKTLTEFILTKLGQRALPQVCQIGNGNACARRLLAWCQRAHGVLLPVP